MTARPIPMVPQLEHEQGPEPLAVVAAAAPVPRKQPLSGRRLEDSLRTPTRWGQQVTCQLAKVCVQPACCWSSFFFPRPSDSQRLGFLALMAGAGIAAAGESLPWLELPHGCSRH